MSLFKGFAAPADEVMILQLYKVGAELMHAQVAVFKI